MINHVRIKRSCHESMDSFKELQLPEAKKACVEKFGKLPRYGYEVIVAEQKPLPDWFLTCTGYTTYLANEGGVYRVWTYFR